MAVVNQIIGDSGKKTVLIQNTTTYETREQLSGLATSRYCHAAATDGNGNVLFGGGYNNSYPTNINRYTPDGVRIHLNRTRYARRRMDKKLRNWQFEMGNYSGQGINAIGRERYGLYRAGSWAGRLERINGRRNLFRRIKSGAVQLHTRYICRVRRYWRWRKNAATRA